MAAIILPRWQRPGLGYRSCAEQRHRRRRPQAPDRIPAWCGFSPKACPVAATDAELRVIRNLGGESDSTSRQVARYVAEVAEPIDGGQAHAVFRLDRYLRGGDHYSFQPAGLRGCAFHRVPRELSTISTRTSAPKMASNMATCRNWSISTMSRTCPGKCCDFGFAGFGAGAARESPSTDQGAGERLDPDLGRVSRQPMLRSALARHHQSGMGTCAGGWKCNPHHLAHIEG